MTEQTPEFTLFEGPTETGLDIYRGSQDPDERALVLNRQIVQTQEGVITPGSMRALKVLFTDEREIIQYRPSIITSLSHENLMAVANGLVAVDPADDPLSQAEEQIRRAAQEEGSQSPIISAPQEFEEDILDELAERLENHNVTQQERAELISIIDATVTTDLLRKIIREKPLVLATFVRNVEEFSNDDLRTAVMRLSSRLTR